MPNINNNDQFIPGGGTFIPEEPSVTPEDATVVDESHSAADLFLLISIILLSVSLATAAGMYLYNKYLLGKIAQSKNSIALAAKDITPETISELDRIGKQMLAAKFVLDNHIATSQIFKALEEHTLKNVQISKLHYELQDNIPKISMDGLASSMNALAAQSKELSETKSKFLNVIFSEFGYDESGYVKFKVESEMNKNYINFTNKILQDLREQNLNPNQNLNPDQQNNMQGAVLDQAELTNEVRNDEFGLPNN